jgi:hypothetical protein
LHPLDRHFHEFQTGGVRGTRYPPLGGDEDFFGVPAVEELTVTVGELLPAVGTTLTYTYHLGDKWVHGLEVEEILTSEDDGGQLRAALPVAVQRRQRTVAARGAELF